MDRRDAPLEGRAACRRDRGEAGRAFVFDDALDEVAIDVVPSAKALADGASRSNDEFADAHVAVGVALLVEGPALAVSERLRILDGL
ncbi:MAG: hypothetical protein U0235_20270 [Polyangiaceae bacterium]